MNKRIPAALLLGMALFLNVGPSGRTTPTVADAMPPANRGHTGHPAIRWVIPGKYWMNTRKPVWLGGLQGHVTVIEFMRIHCIHCQEAAPYRRALYWKFRKLGLKMVGFQSPGNIADPSNTENDWDTVKHTLVQWKNSLSGRFRPETRPVQSIRTDDLPHRLRAGPERHRALPAVRQHAGKSPGVGTVRGQSPEIQIIRLRAEVLTRGAPSCRVSTLPSCPSSL